MAGERIPFALPSAAVAVHRCRAGHGQVLAPGRGREGLARVVVEAQAAKSQAFVVDWTSSVTRMAMDTTVTSSTS